MINLVEMTNTIKSLKVGFFLLIVIALSSCRAHCGCPMAETEQKNTIRSQEQTDGDLSETKPAR